MGQRWEVTYRVDSVLCIDSIELVSEEGKLVSNWQYSCLEAPGLDWRRFAKKVDCIALG